MNKTETVMSLKVMAKETAGDTSKLPQWLNDKYGEGIPLWMLERGMSPKQIDDMMELRRRAFPKTAR
jgi:hypothetical protein